MNPEFDIAIIGAGAMGSAAAYHLSKTGKRVALFDRHYPPHSLGSSHGETRIIREAYFESPMYVPLVKQAYAWWNLLEQESGVKLFQKTGGLMIGHRGQRVFEGALRSAELYGVDAELLSAEKMGEKFPVLLINESDVALLEPNAGILFPEECIAAHLAIAEKNGVQFHFDDHVLSIHPEETHVGIVTAKRNYVASRVILSAGAWMSKLLAGLALPLDVRRQVLFWFRCTGKNAEQFGLGRLPIFIWQASEQLVFYGFPDLGRGFKIAIHHQGAAAQPDSLNRVVAEHEIEAMTALVKERFDAELMYDRSAVCMYTNTPDEDFVIDFYPGSRNVILVSACSGHGFKFSSAIGKIACDMALDCPVDFDLSPFRLSRFNR